MRRPGRQARRGQGRQRDHDDGSATRARTARALTGGKTPVTTATPPADAVPTTKAAAAKDGHGRHTTEPTGRRRSHTEDPRGPRRTTVTVTVPIPTASRHRRDGHGDRRTTGLTRDGDVTVTDGHDTVTVTVTETVTATVTETATVIETDTTTVTTARVTPTRGPTASGARARPRCRPSRARPRASPQAVEARRACSRDRRRRRPWRCSWRSRWSLLVGGRGLLAAPELAAPVPRDRRPPALIHSAPDSPRASARTAGAVTRCEQSCAARRQSFEQGLVRTGGGLLRTGDQFAHCTFAERDRMIETRPPGADQPPGRSGPSGTSGSGSGRGEALMCG